MQDDLNPGPFVAMTVKQYKCVGCGVVYSAMPMEWALSNVRYRNELLARSGRPASATISDYLHCRKCGTQTTDFVPAGEGDVPRGTTIRMMVVPGAWD